MKMEMLIKFKCGNVAKVYFLALKDETKEAEAAHIFIRASLEDHSFLSTNTPIEHYELFEVSNLVRAIYEGLANITLAELENNLLQIGVRIPVKLT